MRPPVGRAEHIQFGKYGFTMSVVSNSKTFVTLSSLHDHLAAINIQNRTLNWLLCHKVMQICFTCRHIISQLLRFRTSSYISRRQIKRKVARFSPHWYIVLLWWVYSHTNTIGIIIAQMTSMNFKYLQFYFRVLHAAWMVINWHNTPKWLYCYFYFLRQAVS